MGKKKPVDIEARWREIRDTILANADQLGNQGIVCSKTSNTGRTIWRLRYVDRSADGKAVHRAIGIGADPELLRRAQELLARCRQRAGRKAEVEGLRRISESVVGLHRDVLSMRNGRQKEQRP